MAVLSRKLAPALAGYPALNPQEVRENQLKFFNRIWKEYGDLVRARILPNYSFYLAAHPSYAEHILSTHQEIYAKPDIVNKPMKLMMGKSILTSEGDFWLKHRRLMQPAFHMKHLANLAGVIVSCTEAFIKEWQNKPDGEVIDIATETLRLTFKIAGQTLFSKDISDEDSVLGKSFREGFEFISYKMNHLITEPLWIPTARNLRFRRAK